MKKGIIMDVDERFLTLLTPEGEFLKARKQKQDYLIGEEIDFFPVATETEKKKSWFFKLLPGRALPAAAVAIIVAAASFIPFHNSNDVYAYMSIDVNPSIELAVNDDLKVVELEAYNAEGENIINEITDWKYKEVTLVTSNIIDEIKVQGFFEEHKKVVIPTVYDEIKEVKVEQQLESNLDQIEMKFENENLEVTVVKGTKAELKEAHKQGVTTGIYKEKQKQQKDQKVEDKSSSKVEKGNSSVDQPKNQPSELDTKKEKNKNTGKEVKGQKGKQDAPGKVNKEAKQKNEKKNEEQVKKNKNENPVVGNDQKLKTNGRSKPDLNKEKAKNHIKERNNKQKNEKKKNKDKEKD